MVGPATEAVLQTQWKAAIDILETLRVHADDTQAAAAGKYDTLLTALDGDNTPEALARAVENHRAGLSQLMSRATVREFLDPILAEYAKVIDGQSVSFGGAYQTPEQILESMYEYFVAQSPATEVETRGIAFDGSFAYQKPDGSANTGNGILTRLTVDENGYELEAVTVEKKHFRCRQDANSGADEEAEVFEVLGQRTSRDWLLNGSFAIA
jgi:hypothetical protein